MIATILVTLLVLVVTALFVLWLKRRRIYKLTEKIPGPKALPILGNTLQFPTESEAFYLYLEALCTTYKDSGFYRLWLGPHLAIVVYRADLLEPFFNSSKHITKSFIYYMHRPWLKTGLLTSTGEKWRVRRKMITPTFHFKILEEFLEVMNEQTQVLVELFHEKVGQGSFDVQPYIANCTLDIICETAMGCQIDAQHEPSDYVEAILRVSDHFFRRMKNPVLWSETLLWLHPFGRPYYRTVKILHDFTLKVIRERSAIFDRQWKAKMAGKTATTEPSATGNDEEDDSFMEEKPIRIGKRMAFLDMLLWNAKKDASMKLDDIREEVDTFMFEGHDTTSGSVVWALFFIGRYPEVQTKLQQEVDAIFGDDDRPVTMEDLNHFKYLECVFKEAMRLYPTVPLFGREVAEDVEIGGCFVPKGATAIILTHPLHRDPKYFPDPDRFDPDRWLTDNPTDKHPFCYLPFSAGLRNCVGQRFAIMELKVMLSAIIRKFNITCHETDDIQRSGLLILRPSKGLQIELSRR